MGAALWVEWECCPLFQSVGGISAPIGLTSGSTHVPPVA